MKKLMIALAAVAFAAVAQAAVVNWQVGSINGAGAGGIGWGADPIDGDGYLATLIVGTGVDAGVITGQVEFDSGATTSDVYTGYMFGNTSDSLTDDATYYAQVIITYGGSTLASQIVTIETAALTGSADPAFAFTGEYANVSPLSGATFDATYGTFSASGWQIVPEPTSGLLMLLGMAGLALKRKRA